MSRIHDEPSLRRTLWAQGALACALAAWGCPAKDDPGALASKPSASVEAVATTVSHAYHAVPVEDAKAIAVRVDFAHPRPPPSWPIPRMVQSQCGDSDHVLDEALSASPDGGANGAVVWLEDIHEGRPLAAADAVQDEKHCVFTPHILALPASGTLTLTNGDPANHADRFEFGGDSSLDFMKTLPGGGKLGPGWDAELSHGRQVGPAPRWRSGRRPAEAARSTTRSPTPRPRGRRRTRGPGRPGGGR